MSQNPLRLYKVPRGTVHGASERLPHGVQGDSLVDAHRVAGADENPPGLHDADRAAALRARKEIGLGIARISQVVREVDLQSRPQFRVNRHPSPRDRVGEFPLAELHEAPGQHDLPTDATRMRKVLDLDREKLAGTVASPEAGEDKQVIAMSTLRFQMLQQARLLFGSEGAFSIHAPKLQRHPPKLGCRGGNLPTT